MADTLLALSGQGIAPYSARGLTQTLEPISEASQLRRTVNGDADNLAPDQFRKFRSTISCTDVNAPALSGLWPGMVLWVDCVSELSFPTANPEMQERPEVIGSTPRTEGDYTWYRPRLQMVVLSFSASTAEWQATTSWQLQLEER